MREFSLEVPLKDEDIKKLKELLEDPDKYARCVVEMIKL